MKKIVIGFTNKKALGSIKRELQKMEADAELICRSSKQAVIDILESEDIDAALLTKNIGYEEWTIEELAKLRDNTNTHILPILPKAYYGTSDLKTLYHAGITSTILQAGRGLKASEIAMLLMKPRNLKAARQYYGIANLSDNAKAHENEILSFDQIARYRAALHDTNYGKTLGQRYYELAMRMTPRENMHFLKHLDERMLHNLTEFPEYYDVLDILKKSGVKVFRYKRPKHLQNTAVSQDHPVIEGEIIDRNGVQIKEEQDLITDDVEEGAETMDEQGTLDNIKDEEELGFATEESEAIPEEDTDIGQEHDENPFIEYQGDFQTSDEDTGEEADDESDSEYGFSESTMEEYLNEVVHSDDPGPPDPYADANDFAEAVEKINGETMHQTVITPEDTQAIHDLLEEEEAEEAVKELLNDKSKLVGVSIVCAAVLVVLLIVVGIVITIKRNNRQQAMEETENIGYDLTYSDLETEAEESFYQLEVTDNGTLVNNKDPETSLNQEEAEAPTEETLEEIHLTVAPIDEAPINDTTVSDNTVTYVTIASDRRDEPEETADNGTTTQENTTTTSVSAVSQSITNKSEKRTQEQEIAANYPSFNYKPASLSSEFSGTQLKEGELISGLALLNTLNAENGQNCIIEFANGKSIEVIAQEVTPGEISIRSQYLISRDGSTLKLIEQ